jgi:NAD-dependent dihydropyrimidine dehydrogenase PreA subunit
MGLKAEYELSCDGCGRIKKATVVFGKDECDDYYDMMPDEFLYGWIQTMEDKKHMFFHDDKCFEKYLCSQGRIEEADEFVNAVWIA